MTRRRRICFISYGHPQNPNLRGGGAERNHIFASRLSKKYDVYFVTGNFEETKTPYKLIRVGVQKPLTASVLSFSVLLPFIVLRGKWDLVIEDWSPFFMSLAPLKHRAIIQFQIYIGKHVFSRFPPPFNLLAWFNQTFYPKLFDTACFMSPVLPKLWGWQKNCKVIWSGFPANYLSYPSRDEGFALFLGRISIYMKGLDVLVKALGISGVKCVIAGDGQDMKKLRDMVRDMQNVKVLGWVDGEQKVKLLSSCSFVVLPSRYEGFGLSILEGFAFGKPAVISDIEAFAWARDYSITSKAGDPYSLADAMRRMMEDKNLRQELGGKARKFASRFTWDKVSADFERFVGKVLES